jgi:hypothetical protein
MGSQRRSPENGVSSTKSLGTTPINVAQNSHWWLRSKTGTNPDSEYDYEKNGKG